MLQRHLICGQRLYAGFLSWDLPGDPAEAAGAILHMAGLQDPPLRLLLSSDAFRFVEQNDLAKMEAGLKWRALSISTDFAADPSPFT